METSFGVKTTSSAENKNNTSNINRNKTTNELICGRTSTELLLERLNANRNAFESSIENEEAAIRQGIETSV